MRIKGLNQTAVAREMGVDQKTVSDWLRGRYRPSVSRNKDLARVLGKSVEELVDMIEAGAQKQAA
jgi:transcriptional regulator with XRE-family HTH domain